MNAPTKDCDHRRIDDFLDSNRVGLEDEQLLEHLNTCIACREYMETQAADSESWTSAGRLLQPGEFDHASSDEYSLATRGSGPVDPPAAIQSVLDYLSPTEEPSRLGRLGTYEVSGVVGAGGMGVVLKAVDPALDRVVAIKVMAPHLANNGTARRRFSREAKAAAAVLHPNVIPIHSVSSDEKIPYLVMAYIRGGSLQKRLDLEGPLSTVEILRIGSQVAAGLAAAHEQGLVHRDVKPENILQEEGVERITLTDFGLARAVDDASVTQPGTIAGTPQYMSPEQTRDEPIDQQSDLFSLGCVLYALCTGRPPFRADSSYAVMRKISDESPMPIRELNPEIPEWLCAIISKLMAKNKADRFGSAHEVHKLLEACINHVQQPTHTELPVSLRMGLVTARPQEGPKNFLTSRIGLVTMLGLLFTGIVAFMIQSIDDSDKSTTGQEASRQRQVIEIEEELLGDLELLQGSWITESVTESGKKISTTDKEADLVRVRLEGDEKGLPQYVDQRLPEIQVVGSTFYKIDPDDGDWHSFRIEIDSTKNPKTIDLISLRHPDEKVFGIYEFKDGALKICFADLDGVDAAGWGQPNPNRKPSKRPAKFNAEAGSKNVLFECWPLGQLIYKMLHDEGKGLLSKDQQDELVELILKRQADRTLPWRTKMGNVIEKRWVAGKLNRELWERYTAQLIDGFYAIKVRPRIVIGTPAGVNLQLETQTVRCGSGKHITFEVRETNRVTKIGATIIGRNDIPGTIPLGQKGGRQTMGSSNNFGKQMWESIRPGKQKITFEAQLAIVESSTSDKKDQQEVFVSRKVTFESETTFLPPGQTTVNISTDPAMEAEVDRSITIKRIETNPAVNPSTDNKYYANVILDITSRPIDIAFNIILKDGDNEYKAGSIAAAAEKKTGLNCMAFIPADLSGKRIDVILRPAPDEAEQTVDLFEIWGEEIVFKDVLVTMVRDSNNQVLIRPDKQVTHITEPLDDSGHVDYLEAINQRYSRGVTAATNWTVALLKEFGPPKLRHDSLTDFWHPLGIQPISPDPVQPFLQGYRFGNEYSELDQKASESYMNSRGPWTANQFPHEARWLGMRKLTLDRLVDASKLPHNYVPQVTSAEEHARRIEEVQDFFNQQLQSKNPGERLGAAIGAMLTSNMRMRTAPLSRVQGTDSAQYGRELARMLSRRALLRIGEADIQAAQSDLLAIHRVGLLSGQGNLLQWIMGMAIDEMASVADLDMVESDKLTKEECEQYLRLLKQLPASRQAMELLNVETRFQALDAIQFAALHHEETIRQLSKIANIDKLALSRIQELDWSEVLRRVNRLFDEQHDLYNSPGRSEELIAYEESEPQLDPEQYATILIERAKKGPEELTAFMAQMYFDQISSRNLRRVESRPKTRRRVVQAGLAAELYRFEHGAYPESLDLLQSLVSEPLVDAFTGKPFQLKTLENGVLIYSLGLNGTDEAGVDIAKLDGWSGPGPTPDDISVRLEPASSRSQEQATAEYVGEKQLKIKEESAKLPGQAIRHTRFYQLNIAVQRKLNSIVQTIDNESTAERATQDVANLFPLMAEIQFLENALQELDWEPGRQQHNEYRREYNKLSDEYSKLTANLKDKPYFKVFAAKYDETSRKARTLVPYSIPEGHAQRGDGPEFVIRLPKVARPQIDLSGESGWLEVFVVDENTEKLIPQRENIRCGGKAFLPTQGSEKGSLIWLRPIREPGFPEFSGGLKDVNFVRREKAGNEEMFFLKTKLNSKDFSAALRQHLGAGWKTRVLGDEDFLRARLAGRSTGATVNMSAFVNAEFPGVEVRSIHLTYKNRSSEPNVGITIVGTDSNE